MFYVCSNVLLISSSFFGSIASSYYFSVVSFCFLASFIFFWCVIWCFFIWNLPTTSTASLYINCSKSSNVVALSFDSLCCKCCWYVFRNVSEMIFYEILLILAISFCIFIVIFVWSVFVCSFQFRVLTAQKIKFSIKGFFSKCLLQKSLMENFIFCAGTLLN